MIQMNLPRFSTRALFVAVAVCAVIALLLSWAMRGGILGDLGIIAAAAAVMAGLIVVFHLVLVGVCRLFAAASSRRERQRPIGGDGGNTTASGVVIGLIFATTAFGQPAFNQVGYVGGGLDMGPPEMPFNLGEGYTPVRFKIAATPPSAADRELTIELRLGWGRGSYSGLTASKSLTIPAGSSTAVETTILWPPSSWTGPLWFDVLEAGKPIQGLSGNINPNAGGWPQGNRPSTLAIIGGAALSGTQQSNVTRRWQIWWQAQGMPGVFGPLFLGSALSELPENWLEYSNVDLLAVTLADAKSMAQANPTRWRAIRDWTLAGGNLFIFGLDKSWNDLGELDALVGLAAGSSQTSGWKQTPNTIPVEENNFNAPSDVDDPDPRPKKRGQVIVGTEAFKGPRPYGMGQVLVSNLATIADVRTDLLRKILPQVGMDRLHASARHGVTLQAKNDDFYEFLVPGVGLAPVTEFSILITLFAVIVGPVNFYLLRQRKRLYLLLISVPLAAALVTAGLLAYATIGEGLGVRVRARSVTQLDQRSGDAVTWARLSYYAGVGPSDGLRFSADTAVLPIHAFRHDDTEGRRAVHWSEDQHLAGGWLPARSPTQFLTIRPRRSSARLNVVLADGKPVRVENALGVAVTHVAVFDDESMPYVAQNVAPGASATLAADGNLQPIGEALFEGQSSKQMPEGLSDLQSSRGLFEMRNRDWYYYGPGRFGRGAAATGDASRLERTLAVLGGSKAAIFDTRNQQPRTYVAVAAESPELVFGLDSVEEEASFHVILGKW